MRLCKISDEAMLPSIALRWLSVRPKWFTFFPCLIVLLSFHVHTVGRQFVKPSELCLRLFVYLLESRVKNQESRQKTWLLILGSWFFFYSSSSLYLARFIPKDKPFDLTR